MADRLVRWLPVALVCGVIAMVARRAAAPIRDPDDWWHLRLGNDLIDQHSLATPGWSTYGTVPWVPTEPLPEVVAAYVERWAGLPGLAALFWLAALAVVVAVHAANRREAGPGRLGGDSLHRARCCCLAHLAPAAAVVRPDPGAAGRLAADRARPEAALVADPPGLGVVVVPRVLVPGGRPRRPGGVGHRPLAACRRPDADPAGGGRRRLLRGGGAEPRRPRRPRGTLRRAQHGALHRGVGAHRPAQLGSARRPADDRGDRHGLGRHPTWGHLVEGAAARGRDGPRLVQRTPGGGGRARGRPALRRDARGSRVASSRRRRSAPGPEGVAGDRRVGGALHPGGRGGGAPRGRPAGRRADRAGPCAGPAAPGPASSTPTSWAGGSPGAIATSSSTSTA